jgi:hypothetical protein
MKGAGAGGEVNPAAPQSGRSARNSTLKIFCCLQ